MLEVGFRSGDCELDTADRSQGHRKAKAHRSEVRSTVAPSCTEMLGIEGLEELVRQSAPWRHGRLADDLSLVVVELR